MQSLLQWKALLAFALGAGTGLYAYFAFPFPRHEPSLMLIAVRSPLVYEFVAASYVLFLFTTPWIFFSLLFSTAYIFLYRLDRDQPLAALPPYPDPGKRDSLFLVIGEVHKAKKPEPSPHPRWLTIPERGLFTGIAILGAIGTGKTSGCMYPFAEQILAYQAQDSEKKIGGLVLEVKGDFCNKVREILRQHNRGDDYIEISLDTDYRYNPLQNDLDAYALAYGVASLLNNLFGRGKEPFWQQAYTNLVKFIILLHKVLYDYVTLFDVYECAIDPELLENKIKAGESHFQSHESIYVSDDDFLQNAPELDAFGFSWDDATNAHRCNSTPELIAVLQREKVNFITKSHASPDAGFMDRQSQFQAVKRWFHNDWLRLDNKLRTSIIEGISVFLSLFDDSPSVKRVFCPPAECYDQTKNADHRYGKPLPSFAWLIEQGYVCALNFPVATNPGLARAIGTLMKLDFQRAVLNRIPEMEKHPGGHFREVLFLCDEYQHFATVGESDPNGDEKFFSLSRQPKCIPIVATQSISSLRSTLYGEAWRTLLQTFRTKIFLSLSDDFSARTAADICGKEDKLRVNYNLSESSNDARVSLLTGKSISNQGSLSTSKSYNLQNEYIFDSKTFTQLKNAQSIALAYDGLNPLEPTYCYLKPYYLNPNKSYFQQLADKEI